MSSQSSKRQKSIPLDCWGDIVHYLDYVTGTTILSVVSSDLVRKTAELKRSATFKAKQLVLADGSLALDRLEAASVRFPALEDVSVNLSGALSDREGFTDARRALILAKLCTCTFITRLHLSGNDIAVLPDAIGALTNLKELDLGHNQLTALPDSIGSLTALGRLHLHNNKLVTLPDSIGSLAALTTLFLSNNQLEQLPDLFDKLTALENVHLDGNKLTALPNSIVALTNLKHLYIHGNSFNDDQIDHWFGWLLRFTMKTGITPGPM